MENVPMDKAVMAQFLKAGFMEQGEWHETDSSTPQGGIVSPIYCNLALDGMERMLDEHFTLGGTGRRDWRKAGRSKVHLARYADDFVVTAASPEVALEAKALPVPFLAERGLELSEEKTLVTSVAHGFDFLGWNLRKHGESPSPSQRKKSVDAFLAETHRAILVNGKGVSQEELIRLLLPKVRGFANYHRHACSSKAFSRIAHVMYLQLRRWTRRRHPTKGLRWIYPRYWLAVGADNYVFGTPELYLPPMAWQHIVRHTPLKTDMNPYLNREYFDKRAATLRRCGSGSFHRPASTH